MSKLVNASKSYWDHLHQSVDLTPEDQLQLVGFLWTVPIWKDAIHCVFHGCMREGSHILCSRIRGPRRCTNEAPPLWSWWETNLTRLESCFHSHQIQFLAYLACRHGGIYEPSFRSHLKPIEDGWTSSASSCSLPRSIAISVRRHLANECWTFSHPNLEVPNDFRVGDSVHIRVGSHLRQGTIVRAVSSDSFLVEVLPGGKERLPFRSSDLSPNW
jgi:hypothetical protein